MDNSIETSKRKESLLRTMRNLQVKSDNALQKASPLLSFQQGMGMVTKQHITELSQKATVICHDLADIENLLRLRQNELVQRIPNPHGNHSKGINGIHCSLDGTVCITSTDSPWVHMLNRSGQTFQSLQCVEAGGNKEYFLPEDITVTRAGMVAVTDMVCGVVRVFSPHSRFSKGEWIRIGKIESPRGISVDFLGKILVTDYTPGKVHIFAIDHTFKVLNIHSISGLRGPRYVCSAPEGNIIISEECSDVKMYGSNHKLVYSFGAKYGHQFGNPAGVCADAEGNIIVVDEQEKKVFLFPKTGSPLCLVSEGLKQPTGVACSSYGQLLVVDPGDNCIKIYKYRVTPQCRAMGVCSHSPNITPREKDG
nr:PREDICTED: NHL-repeat-containing protein 4 [Latimeria chalumnae]|eukprot:XP_014340853.1 PREDICTED: NHL-repeat-containing protein 4 [Latimeria chalumnae]